MKIKLLILSIIFSSVQAFGLQVAVSPQVFKASEGSYLEVNYQVIGNSVSFDTLQDNRLQAAVDVTIIFSLDSSIVKFDKYRLRSPAFNSPKDFLDIRKYALDPGVYSVYLEFRDAIDSTNRVVYDEIIDIPDYTEKLPRFSTIKLLASLKKAEDKNSPWVQHGLLMEPLPHNFYDQRHDFLSFYTEVYGLPDISQRPLLLKMDILNKQAGDWVPVQTSYQKIDSYNEVEAFARKLAILKLNSDTYMLKLSLIDANKKSYASATALFVRSNPGRDQKLKEQLLADKSGNFFNDHSEEELEYAIRAIAPQAPASMQERINFLVAGGTAQSKRDFLYGYWIDQDPLQPEKAYRQYMSLIDALDEKYYSAFGHGFETDRGRIYLKYGPPTQIVNRQNDQSARPYEIWTYDRIDLYNQTNVKFVFYNPTLGGNDYELLHSNARNEIQNPKWLQYIYYVPDEFEGNTVDGTGVQDNFGREASRLFNDN